MKIKNNINGFTLIEMITSIVLIGILATFMSMGVGKIIEGYIFTKANADTTLRAQMALTRLMKEFSSIDQVSNGSKTSITYSYIRNGISIPSRTVSWSGTASAPLLLGGNILIENVNDFELSYHMSHSDGGDHNWGGAEKMIGITLKTTGASDVVSFFSIRVIPRNL